MTEVEWLTCRDPEAMLEFLGDKAGERKLYLLRVAATVLNEEAPRRANPPARYAEPVAEEAVRRRAQQLGIVPGERGYAQLERVLQNHLGLLRCLFGNPFRPVPTNPSWLTGEVRSLAEAAYKERQDVVTLDPLRLAVLADALEEAGCTDPDVLDHCRRPAEHAQGCWLLDQLLRGR
jgi:hypothetical protein